MDTDTAFIGRAADLARLAGLLAVHRIVTVLGPAGMGKTRLALRASSLAPWPALVSDVSHATTGDGVCAAVAETLGEPVGSAPGFDAVGAALAARGPCLLVLDNLEQVTVAGAAAVAAWLAAAPQLRVLATSRERLGVRGEVLHELGPLEVPVGNDPSGSEAVALFALRAREVSPEFATQDDPAAVAAIVRRLDGIPLAIELAAARARVLAPRQLLERLEQRFGVLRAADRFAEPRQATLWGALEWSWQLLDDAERRAFADLSVFPAGFVLDAAEHVLETDAMDVVQALRDKSLVRAAGAGELRFGFYESIRAFGLVKLDESGRRAAVDARFCGWIHGRTGDWSRRVHSRQGGAARAALTHERENGLAVIRTALDRGDVGLAADVLLALDPVLSTRGPFDLHEALLDELLDTDGAMDPETRSRVHEARGNVHRTRGALDRAVASFRRGLNHAPAHSGVEASLVANLGIALHERGRLEEAGEHHHRARALFAALGDRRGEARALGSLAILQQEQGALADAERSYRDAIAIFRTEGDRRSEGIFLINLGDLYKEQQLLPTARQHYEEGLGITRDLGDRRVEGVVLGNLGGIAQEEGRNDDALRLREEAVRLMQEVGDQRLEGVFTGYLGTVHHAALERERAARFYRSAVTLLEGAGDVRFLAIFLGYLGAAEAGLGRRAAAEAAFDRAREAVDGLGDELLRVALELHEGHLDLATGAVDSVRARMGHALGRGASAGGDLAATPAGRSDEVRFAITLLELALDEAGGESGEHGEAFADPSDALVVSADGRSFRLPGGEHVNLGRRKAPRLILLELVRRRLSGEGGLGVYDLMDVGWPGEILHPESGSNRVYVAITTLRNLGLRDVLVHRDDGYVLDASVPVVHG